MVFKTFIKICCNWLTLNQIMCFLIGTNVEDSPVQEFTRNPSS